MHPFGEREQEVQPLLVSVIIVSWQAKDYLVQCLDSLTEAASSYPLEIIVVDNASTDGSPEFVAARYGHVKLVRSRSNLGFAKANNLGIRMSSGRYVALINSDVKVLRNCITVLVDYLKNNPRAGLVGPRIIGGDGKLQRSCRGHPSLWNMFCRALALDKVMPAARVFSGYSLRHWAQESLQEVDILTGCFWLARREALDQVGLLDETFFMYGEDMDWCKRFALGGWKVVFVPTAEAIHYGGASSSNAPQRFYIERHRADIQYWRKHHSRLAVACFVAISWLHLMLRAAGHGLSCVLRGRDRRDHLLKVARSLACLRWMVSGHIPNR